MQNFQKGMPAKLLLVQNWDKMIHLTQTTTVGSFENFLYTTIVCNATALSQTALSLSLSYFKF